MTGSSSNDGSVPVSAAVHRLDALDVTVLRLLVAKWDERLKRPVGLGYTLLAAQLTELVLAGVLVDHNDRPVVVRRAAVADGAFAGLVDRIRELSGWRWDQLFWRRGVDSRAVLAGAVDFLVGAGFWETRPGGRLRAVRYRDHAPEWTESTTALVQTVVRDPATAAPRAGMLAALYSLGAGPQRGQGRKWSPARQILDQPGLTADLKQTLVAIVTSAQAAMTSVAVESTGTYGAY